MVQCYGFSWCVLFVMMYAHRDDDTFLMYVMSVDENDLQSLPSVPITFVSIFNRDYSILP